jgi:hypothetical protein
VIFLKVNFFIHELRRIQERFNQTFGVQAVCDLKTRLRVILAIIHLEMLSRQIISAENTDKVREEICRFVKTKNILNEIFNRAETYWKERRCDHVAKTGSTQQAKIH